VAALFLFCLAFPAAAARNYHLELEAYPAAPFPSFYKFGTVTVHVFPGGVSAESLWLRGFTRQGSKAVTVVNPVMRMYTDVPITEITSIIAKGTDDPAVAAPPIVGPTNGKVGSLRAARYRLMYGPDAWVDVWTTMEIPDNPQFRLVVDGIVRGLSETTAAAARRIPGTPVYIELNFRRFQKVPFLKLKSLTWNNSAERETLKVGAYYVKAPLLDAIWR